MTEFEEYVLNEQVRKIADHMDFGVMSMLLIDSCGWTKVELDTLFLDPLSWANNNCQGRFMNNDNIFVFENANDAVIFKLKWA